MSHNLANALIKAQIQVKVGELYYHYKNPRKFYILDKIAINEADEKIMVIYTSCDHEEITWIRPLDSWLEIVDGVPRFNLIE